MNKDRVDITVVKNKVVQLEQNKWKQEIRNKPKLRFYCKFKKEKKLEPYISMQLLPRERSYLTQVRLDILPINIETGRYKSIPLERRICTLCNLDQIEDEIHILFYCNKYNLERKDWLSKMNIQIQPKSDDNMLNNIFLFTQITAKYIAEIMCVRQKSLFS